MSPSLRPLLILLTTVLAAYAAEAGASRVATWCDDKTGAFMLMFDDGAPTDVKNVIPELTKRGLVGTFYLNPGAGHYQPFKQEWEERIPKLGMEYANHTMTHAGARDVANAEEEITACNAVILRVAPGPAQRLVSFGRPGVKPGAWNITDPQLAELLAKHHLVERPPLGGHGSSINQKSAADLIKLADEAVAKGEAQYVVFHGVGGDWLSTPMDQFTALLDHLVSLKDRLWIAGHIAVHKYETERKTATVTVGVVTTKELNLTLRCAADPLWYDAPLTVITQVPAGWTACTIDQGTHHGTAKVVDGAVRFAAIPGTEAVVIRAAP